MPLDPKLNKFSTASPALVNFSFEDIANGLGVSLFYATRVKDPGLDYILTSNVVPSTTPGYMDTSEESGGQDFDLTPFNLARTATGVALISGTFYRKDTNIFITFKLIHWDGTTETDITGAISSPTITGSDATEDILIELPITTIKRFRKGDILRLRVDFGTAIGSGALGIDPTGTAVGIDSQVLNPLKVFVPFKIEQ